MQLLFQRYIYPVLLATFILIGGCKKFVDVEPPRNSLTSATVFASDQGALSAMAGLYSQMTQTNLNIASGGLTLYCGLSADEIVNTSSNSNHDPFRMNSLTADVSSVGSRFWSPAYKTIYQANSILEGISNSDGMSASVKRQVEGEALVVRAFHYFYLVNLFGDVPYLTSSDYLFNSKAARDSKAVIMQGVVADLTRAALLLRDNYPSNGKGRPNRFTALALLARSHLQLNNWGEVEMLCDTIIGSGRYSLVGNLTSVFASNSAEAIWQLLRDNNNTAEGATFVPSSATVVPPFSLTTQLLNAFEATDNRKTVWIGRNVVSGVSYAYPFKYKLRTSTPIQEYLTVVRLAEIYLLRAEARARQNKLALAANDVNVIRIRAGLPSSSFADQQSLLDAISKERQTELFAEWGHRWFDLKRTQRADLVLAPIKGSEWQATDVLYPIPLAEIQRNPSLTQNPGY